MIKCRFDGKDKQFMPEEIAAMIFEKLKADADLYLVQNTTSCNVSVPANFNTLQRTAIMNSARLAGLEPRLIPSPSLSTVSKFCHESIEDFDEVYAAVVVFGGSSFDISIALIDKCVVEIAATIGDPYLGGEDFDNEIVSHCIDKF